MSVTFVGVRHHSPACARVVRDTIRRLRPAHVLVEGPADMNARIDEVLLGHDLPIAVFTSYRDGERQHASWSPLCEHSPEWIALVEGHAVGAEVRFIDLPAWHEAFAGRANRYSDADRWHNDAAERLCATFAVDNIDTLWDHLFEISPDDDLTEHLVAYFDLVRGDANASPSDEVREAYMAGWIEAAVADAGEREVVVVTGGFHRPALVRRLGAEGPTTRRGAVAWPDVPAFPAGAVGGSYLVPFSFRRLDAFHGYQSGMPSPHYYQRLWEAGPDAAAHEVIGTVVARLRERRQAVSTADLVAARSLALGLARVRGHEAPARTDVLDGLVSALVTDPLDLPLPWTGRGRLQIGTDPVVVEMVAALSGTTVGRLHPDTPRPPLLDDVRAELERHGVPEHGSLALDLTTDAGLATSRVLHRLRVLGVPGYDRQRGPAVASPPVLDERWALSRPEMWLPSVIEAGSFGATLDAAAGAALADALAVAGSEPRLLARVLFDAALCGLVGLSDTALATLGSLVGQIGDLGGLGGLLATVLGLWRHDRLLGAARSPALADVLDAGTTRAVWLVEGVRGGPAPADRARLGAIVAVRDAALHAGPQLSLGVYAIVDVFARSAAPDRPPDLRGASVGMLWALDDDTTADASRVAAAVRRSGRIDELGDFLAGLFAVAREQVLSAAPPGIVGLLDELVGAFTDDEFLVALPSLRLAFSWFPPRERETIAAALLDRRGMRGSVPAFLRLVADPGAVARAAAVDAEVDEVLRRERLLAEQADDHG